MGRFGSWGPPAPNVWLLAALVTACSGGAVVRAADDFGMRLSRAALERTTHAVRYDPAYVAIAYPGGGVPNGQGVCTDVVVRAYRAVGIDLQKDVHEDMAAAFDAFPRIWGVTRPDPNIDHRRVPDLVVLFARRGTVLSASRNPRDHAPGDLVTWRLGGLLRHIGIVTQRRAASGRPLVVHNVGEGPKAEDVLFALPLGGHHRYGGWGAGTGPPSRPPLPSRN